MVSYGDGRTTYKELVSGKMKHKKSIMVFLFIIICMVGLSLIRPARFVSSNSQTIAVVSMSGDRKEDGQSMLRGIRMLINQVNAMGGIYGKPIQIREYDDRGDPKLARLIASNIVENKNVHLVLGHFFSSTSFAAGQIYKKYGLPAITASATDPMVTQNNPWFFRVIPTNTTQGQFIAAYIHGALKKKHASIVYDIDNYGKSLSRSFEKTAAELGINIVKKWAINSTKNVDYQVKTIVEQIRAIKDTSIIFLATHSIEAVKLISGINFPNSGYEIFGPDSLSTVSFMKEFLRFPQERSHPGYFSDNVYATSPFMINISPNPAAFEFRNDFTKRFGHKPSWIASCYYDAALVGVSALKFSQMGGYNFRKDRMEIRKYIEKINTPENAIKGITGDIFFDKFGNTTRSFSVGSFHKQQYFPEFIQYQPIKETPDQEYPIDDIVKGDLALVNNQLMKKGRVVYAGIDINNISNLDLHDGCFDADFYLWFRFEGVFDDKNIVFTNSKQPIALDPPIYEYQTEDFNTKTYHVKGTFQSRLNFRMYPFDHQQLQIKFRHQFKTRDQVTYIPDILGMKHTGIKKSTDRTQLISTMKGWKVYKTDIYQSCLTRSSSFGNPTLFEQPKEINFSIINMHIDIQRDSLDIAFRTFAPLTVIILLIIFAACIPSKRFGIKIGILLPSMVSTIIYHYKLLATLQSLKISFAESVVNVIYALICTGLIFAIIRYITDKKGTEKFLKRIIMVEFVIFPIFVCIFAYCFMGQYDMIAQDKNSLKNNESLAIGEKVQKEDILYWTFNINKSYSSGDIIGTIKHENYVTYSQFQIISGNDDQAFSIDNNAQIFIQNRPKAESTCRELVVSSANNSGKSCRSIVNICLDRDQHNLKQNDSESLMQNNTPIQKPPEMKKMRRTNRKNAITLKGDPAQISSTEDPAQKVRIKRKNVITVADDSSKISSTEDPAQISPAEDPAKISVEKDPTTRKRKRKQTFTKKTKMNKHTDTNSINSPENLNTIHSEGPLRKNAKSLAIMDQIFIIHKNIANNDLVGRIKVRCPEDNQLQFRLVSGNDKNIFSVHPHSGSLYIKDNSNIKDTDTETHFLTVEVINQYEKSDRASITVLINQ